MQRQISSEYAFAKNISVHIWYLQFSVYLLDHNIFLLDAATIYKIL